MTVLNEKITHSKRSIKNSEFFSYKKNNLNSNLEFFKKYKPVNSVNVSLKRRLCWFCLNKK